MTLELSDIERDALPALIEYTSIACLSPDFDNQWEATGHIDAAVTLLQKWVLSRSLRGADVKVHRLEGRTPLLCVTIDAEGTTSDDTVLIYGHLDKQPPLGDWSEGLAPYRAVRRDDGLYGRGVADDGYSTFAAVLAIEDLQRHNRAHQRCVILIEASEESGSPDLEAYLDYLTPHLGHVSLMICLDSGALSYDRLWATTSLRGVVNLSVTVDVLDYGQHSGRASGVVPSSFRILRQLIDRIDDPTTGDVLLRSAHVTIPGDVVAAAYAVGEEFGDITRQEMPWHRDTQPMGDNAAERLLNRTWRPALSVTGVAGMPDLALAGNVLRPSTSLALSLRIPPTANAREVLDELRHVLTTDVPYGATVTLSRTQDSDGWAAPPLLPALREAIMGASSRHFGREAAFVGEGGAIPFLASLQKRFPQVQFLATGVLGPHSNAHSIDEMLHLPTMVQVTNCVADVVHAMAQ